ncbi:MAG: sigma-70 family RNA polymerase sigma factor [Planctomycetota bacterium]
MDEKDPDPRPPVVERPLIAPVDGTPSSLPPAVTTVSASETLESTFRLHQAELLGTLYHLVGNLEDARDAVQEAFVKCWRHRDSVAGVANVKAWIFQIALNAGRDLRSAAWRRKRRDWEREEVMLISNHPPPEAALEHADQMDRLRLALADLRDEEKEVFLLRQNGELTYEQIAVAVGVPVGTVKTRMRLALNHLREALGHERTTDGRKDR